MAAKPDVAIVGGGAIGVCAYELARREASVALYERGPELGSGCSAGNAGLICTSHSIPIANPASATFANVAFYPRGGRVALQRPGVRLATGPSCEVRRRSVRLRVGGLPLGEDAFSQRTHR